MPTLHNRTAEKTITLKEAKQKAESNIPKNKIPTPPTGSIPQHLPRAIGSTKYTKTQK
jgi:hypothetical protein